MLKTNGSSLMRGNTSQRQYRQSIKNILTYSINHCCSVRCVDERNLGLPPPDVGGKDPKKYWNATALAYLGDSVWELHVRSRFFSPPKDMTSYYSTVVSKVRAEAQAKAVKFLNEGDFLSDSEREILRWGRNASGTLPKRLASSNLTREIYRGATALECLVGYLYLTDMNRLVDVMKHLDAVQDS